MVQRDEGVEWRGEDRGVRRSVDDVTRLG
jgi:hypothetical protein